MVRPSTMPPAAITGTLTFSRKRASSSTMLATSAWINLNPPPSPPSTLPARPHPPRWRATPPSATARHGTPVIPASLSGPTIFIGSPAGEVVTNFTPWSSTKISRCPDRARTQSATFSPNGFVVSVRIVFTSARTSSSRPDDVSMIPSPPAFDTALARLRTRNPPHWRLHDRVLDSEHRGEAVLDGQGIECSEIAVAKQHMEVLTGERKNCTSSL